jgi:hypothetical protein
MLLLHMQPPSSLPSHLTTPLLERLQGRGAISSATAVELRCLATVLRYVSSRMTLRVTRFIPGMAHVCGYRAFPDWLYIFNLVCRPRYGDARVAMEVLSSAWPLLSTYVALCCSDASTQPHSGQQGAPGSSPKKGGGVGWVGVWEALLDVLGRAASLPLSQRAMAIRQGADEPPNAQVGTSQPLRQSMWAQDCLSRRGDVGWVIRFRACVYADSSGPHGAQ